MGGSDNRAPVGHAEKRRRQVLTVAAYCTTCLLIAVLVGRSGQRRAQAVLGAPAVAPAAAPPRLRWAPAVCTPPPPPADRNRTEASMALLEARAQFAQWLEAHQRQVQRHWGRKARGARARGIAVAAGSPALLANAFVGLHVLRHRLGCRLPAVIMYWGNSSADVPSKGTQAFMKAHIPSLEFEDVAALPYPSWHTCLDAPGVAMAGWKIKVLFIYHAPFREVLYLDADNMPLADPAELFLDPLYATAGALFWPDIWCGSTALFNVLGLPSIGRERQAESGALLLDRQRHWLALEWLLFLNSLDAYTYRLAYGDKDTFRAAFFLAYRLPAFPQAPLAPALLLLQDQAGALFVRGLLQLHPSSGAPAFLHRVAGGSKFDPSSDDARPVTHLALPACTYFDVRGWFPNERIPPEHLHPAVLSNAGELPCPIGEGELQAAAQRCAQYNVTAANGTDPVPVFEIPANATIARGLEAAEAAFHLLRDAKRRDPQLF